MDIVTAIALGLLGSLHCLGMCGPIALALPVPDSGLLARVIAVLTYNAGRIITYLLMGLFFGVLGKGFALAGLQQALSVIMGVLILLFLLVPHITTSTRKINLLFYELTNKLKATLAQRLAERTNSSMFVVGMLNGLLPCGLVYIAIAGALSLGSIWKGAVFMTLFGAGTTPAMMAVALSANFISVEVRRKMVRVVPYFVSVMAVVLVLRGLNLGIPYLSPGVNAKTNTFAPCHTDPKSCCKKK